MTRRPCRRDRGAHPRPRAGRARAGSVTCLVSGGADSTCLWHALRALGYDVSAVHVHHGVRGADADADAEHCARVLGARVVRVEPAATEAALRELRYAATAGLGLRATGHTASDQVETVLYRLVSSGSTRGIKVRREDGVVRPLLDVRREETAAYCLEHGLAVRVDATNPDTKRGLIRDEILPLLRRLHPGADANLRALGERAAAPAARRSRRRSSSCSRRGPARRRPTSAAACAPCASTTRCGSRARCLGAVDARGRAGRSRGADPAAGGSARRAPQEGAGSARGREGAESGARDLAAGRLRRRGRRGARIADAPGWEGAVDGAEG